MTETYQASAQDYCELPNNEVISKIQSDIHIHDITAGLGQLKPDTTIAMKPRCGDYQANTKQMILM